MYSFDMEPDEKILKKDNANLECSDGHYLNGALYLTSQRLVFVGYMLDIRNKYTSGMSLHHISAVRKQKRFGLFPNMFAVDTLQGNTVRYIIEKRDGWILAIEKTIAELD